MFSFSTLLWSSIRVDLPYGFHYHLSDGATFIATRYYGVWGTASRVRNFRIFSAAGMATLRFSTGRRWYIAFMPHWALFISRCASSRHILSALRFSLSFPSRPPRERKTTPTCSGRFHSRVYSSMWRSLPYAHVRHISMLPGIDISREYQEIHTRCFTIIFSRQNADIRPHGGWCFGAADIFWRHIFDALKPFV